MSGTSPKQNPKAANSYLSLQVQIQLNPGIIKSDFGPNFHNDSAGVTALLSPQKFT